MDGLVTLTIACLIVLGVLIISNFVHLPILGLFKRVLEFLGKTIFKLSAKHINNSEAKYKRDYAVGKVKPTSTRYKLYRFLNELIIDLDLKNTGITPYEMLFIVLLLVAFSSLVLGKLIFGSFLMSFLMYPVLIVATFCVLYTKANIAHDTRIDAIYEAENIICNNITSGVVVAIRQSIDVVPKEVRDEFVTFLDNVEHKNYHIKAALLELQDHLGAVSEDFIKKCIVFETEEEHGVVNVFRDVVSVNNIKTELRTEMKREFEKVVSDFIISAGMILLFMVGVLVVYPTVREFYFHNTIGQLIILLDLLVLITEYVIIARLRAQEI